MIRYEYKEVSLYGDSTSEADPNFGEGDKGYIEKLNFYGAQGWRAAWIDIDSRAHIRVILERELPETTTAPERLAPGAVDRNMLHG